MLSQFLDFNERFANEASLEATLIELYETDSESMKQVSSGITVDTNFEGFCQAPVGEKIEDLVDEIIQYEDALTYQSWLIEHLTNTYCIEYVNLIDEERKSLSVTKSELNSQLKDNFNTKFESLEIEGSQ